MLKTSKPDTNHSTVTGLVDETGAPPSPARSGRSRRVILAGGGIGGLSAAIALRGSGHEVVVLERAPRLDPIGAGITLFANAMDALERLGVAPAVRAAGAAATHSAVLTSDGRELTALPADLLDGAVAIHRADLQAALLEAAGEIRVGRPCAPPWPPHRPDMADTPPGGGCRL